MDDAVKGYDIKLISDGLHSLSLISDKVSEQNFEWSTASKADSWSLLPTSEMQNVECF